MKLNIVVLFAVSLITIAQSFHINDLIKEPVSIAEDTNNKDNFVRLRIKRQLFGQGRRSYYPPVGAQSRAPTVIVVPERGTPAVPAYGNVPISPYGVNTPNRGTGTTVVVSQVPEYNYNTASRGYYIM